MDTMNHSAQASEQTADPQQGGEVDRRFLIFRRFEELPLRRYANLRHRFNGDPSELFPTNRIHDRVARELVRRRATSPKELLESFELYARIRRRLRRPSMVDLCAGHGLTGLLFALLEPSVEHVLLIDEKRPPCWDAVYDVVTGIGPWVSKKVSYEEVSLERVASDSLVPPGASVLLIHGCGSLTDIGIDIGIGAGGPIAVMPCCYRTSARVALRGLQYALGRGLATDIARTYHLHERGYHVDWAAIPRAITPMNRILVAWHPVEHSRVRDAG